MSTYSFRVSTEILRRLGEELITSFDQGIVELVKNSYDADALNCSVELLDTGKASGSAVIWDDGDGMSPEEIRDGWLVLGRSQKGDLRMTRLGRLPAGSKGLGRLGALRMGESVFLSTRSRKESDIEHSVFIHWPDFDHSRVIEDVPISIESKRCKGTPGTRIEIQGLRSGIAKPEVERLARELILLATPFEEQTSFRPKLIAPEFSELESLVRRRYFDDCEYHLVASLDERGRGSAKIIDRSGMPRWATVEGDLPDLYEAPAATFELWVFLLNRESFAGRSPTLTEVRAWLRQVGGVHLYHRGLRVRPYGDPGHDWLDMNFSRSRSPELRPSTNTTVGKFTVLDENEELLQKTDRSGFIENRAFQELRRFGIDALEWMQSKRLAEREEKRHQKRREEPERTTAAAANLRNAISRLEVHDRTPVENALKDLETARASERDMLQEELALYQTLASVGTAVSVFAHEIEGPATDLTNSVRTVERRARRALPSNYAGTLEKQIDAVKRSAELVARFATLPLGLLKRSKRRRTRLSINNALSDTIDLFEPYLVDARILTVRDFSVDDIHVHSSIASIEAVVSNLLTNSVKAFKRQEKLPEQRVLVIRTETDGTTVTIRVLDNGPGVPRNMEDRIWLPGVTSDENGTGLGLTIVRDTVSELGGAVKVIAQGELGGAEFIIELQCQQS